MLIYQYQTDRFNRKELDGFLEHMLPRIKAQQLGWDNDARQLFTTIEWSGLLNRIEHDRNTKLHAFVTALSETMKFEGIAIADGADESLLFDFWKNSERPQLQAAINNSATLWFDEEHSILYQKIRLVSDSLGHKFNLYFFKAWDSAMLHHTSFPETTSYLLLGSHPLLSSAGNLALETSPPGTEKYVEFSLNGSQYHEGSAKLSDVALADGIQLPLELTVRAPLRNDLPIFLVLSASIGVTFLFGLLLYVVLGNWLRRMGTRLDGLSAAALAFKTASPSRVTDEAMKMLSLADGGKNDQISTMSQELSNLMTSAAERDAEQSAYLQTLDLLQDAVIEIAPDGHLLRGTEAWKTLAGIDDIATCSIISCVHPEDVAELIEQIGVLSNDQKDQVSIRFRVIRQNDSSKYFWVEGRFAAVRFNGRITSIRGVVRDITTTYRQERQISHMALHDSLTDLPNRVLLEDRMETSLTRATRTGKRVALGFIDLDHFKQVNDNFGHKLGDRMLKEVTARLLTALRSSDTLSRWGGDEFVVLCPDLDQLDDAREITHKLSLLTRENISIDETDLPFTFSAGFAVFPDDADNIEMLLAQADRAMFYAKAQGRNNIQFFNTIASKETGRHSFYIQSRLIQAINDDHIQCWLQPIISSQTGQVVGAEALARWHEPDQGWIPPSVFIPMAESLGLIDRVGQSVWRQALKALTMMPGHHQLSVNLSKRQLFSSTIVQQLCNDIAKAKIDPDRIMLEFTESLALSDVEYAHERIAELDALGFGISIDDFGVGYSSLSQLHEIPADELKLDISFVRRIHQKTGLSMAKAIISIAESLNLGCVAEGIENETTAALLGSLGVEKLQGFLFSRPMPVSDYLSWLNARTLAVS